MFWGHVLGPLNSLIWGRVDDYTRMNDRGQYCRGDHRVSPSHPRVSGNSRHPTQKSPKSAVSEFWNHVLGPLNSLIWGRVDDHTRMNDRDQYCRGDHRVSSSHPPVARDCRPPNQYIPHSALSVFGGHVRRPLNSLIWVRVDDYTRMNDRYQ